ncbi:MAG: thioredoxin-disulfide reductase [Candidatus Ranarchaeia archaeon]|jgi:thioredoxin reductase (NADPH)
MSKYDLIIIGAGPAGLTAALYAGRAGLKTLVLAKLSGGQVSVTPLIQNYPGVPEITGFELGQIMENQAKKWGAEVYEGVTALKLELDQPTKRVITDLGEYESLAVILAMGAEERRLGVPGEKDYQGRGVSYCATCDGAFFKEKVVAVVGGGNAALTDATYLDNIAKTVHLIHRRHKFRAEDALVNSLKNSQNMTIHFDSIVTEVQGEKNVTGIMMENVKSKKRELVPISGLFIAIGQVPQSEIAKEAGVKLDQWGYILHDDQMKTNIEGVYVAGDITPEENQIAVAVGQGCTAAINVRLYLKRGFYGDK